MKKFFEIIKLAIKIILSILLSGFFLFAAGAITLLAFQTKFEITLLMIILFFILLIYYINWAIWTQGKIRKIIMLFFVIIFFLFMVLISMEPN